MSLRIGIKPPRKRWVLIPCLLCPSCSTTLDPATLPGCAADDTAGSATFSTCADLPPCTPAGEEGSRVLCEHALSYEAASRECELRGGHLAEVASEAENAAIAEIAEQTVGTNVWLGGTRSEAFVWSWTSSQVVFWRGEREGTPEENVFVVWQPGEPNNSSTVSDEPEKCLALTLESADWNDRACSLELPFACEIE